MESYLITIRRHYKIFLNVNTYPTVLFFYYYVVKCMPGLSQERCSLHNILLRGGGYLSFEYYNYLMLQTFYKIVSCKHV
jgi:hypothetical protein